MIIERGDLYIEYSDSMTENEAIAYEPAARQQWIDDGGKPAALGSILLELDGDEVKVTCRSNISRIRRITGYLSAVSNFNEAKKSELQARIVTDGNDTPAYADMQVPMTESQIERAAIRDRRE
ncbi:MAG: anaerobic ribonucleoside-triphosphate reductase [Negativicutes bacterium]|nr:anaerobic ribonucleoside-triphosphate reductase [Negativicutes bacterium]